MNIYSFITMRKRDPTKIKKIFDATLMLVEQNWLVWISMAEIAKHAKIATGTLYIYFPSKEDLFHELYKTTKEAIRIFLFESGEIPKWDYQNQFHTLARKYLNYRMTFYLESIFHEQYTRSPFYSREDKQVSESVLSPILDFLEHGKTLGLLKPLDTTLILMTITTILREFGDGIGQKIIQNTETTIQTAVTLSWDAVSLRL